jgi:hypothetical protein
VDVAEDAPKRLKARWQAGLNLGDGRWYLRRYEISVSWRAAMPDWKKFKFKITGKVQEAEVTPLTLPMARLAEYLIDLADVLGHKDGVHLVAVEEGSAQPVVWIDPLVYSAAIAQMQSAQIGMGPKEANNGYKRLDTRLRVDQGSADFLDADSEAKIFEFPGIKRMNSVPIRGIREQASVTGELRRVGGLDKTIHLCLKRADGEVVYVESDEAFAKQMEGFLFNYIRINGVATWSRDENGTWICDRFRAQSFDPIPLVNEPFETTLDKLKSLPGNRWPEVDDPYEELRKLRHGKDEKTQ